jgi:hypothetical protein
MTARLPPNALVKPPERMMPRTVNALSPTMVESVSRLPTCSAFRSANSFVTMMESGWARKTSGSSTTASSPLSRS